MIESASDLQVERAALTRIKSLCEERSLSCSLRIAEIDKLLGFKETPKVDLKKYCEG